MPDITEIIGVDEKYTIISEPQQTAAAGGNDDLLKGAAIGTAAGRGATIVQKVPQKTYVRVMIPKTIVVNRYIRDTSRLMKAVEELNSPKAMIDAMVIEKKLTGSFVSKKTILGVQTAKVFIDAEQISVDRMVTSQKKELRQSLKEAAYKIKDYEHEIGRFRNTISNLQSSIRMLRTQLQDANIRAKKAEYQLNKLRTKIGKTAEAMVRTRSKLQGPVGGPAAISSNVSKGNFGPMQMAARQAVEPPIKLLTEVQLDQPLFDKPGSDKHKQNLLNNMSRKGRR